MVWFCSRSVESFSVVAIALAREELERRRQAGEDV